MPTVPAFLSAHAMRALSVALAVWAAFWVGIAAYTAYEVNALRALGGTVAEAGAAMETTGKAVQALGGVPVVGGRVGTLGDQVVAAGRSARESGRASRGTAERLAVLLGIAIGVIPTLPLLALYLPLRRSWQSDRRAVSRAVSEWDGEPALETFLARRALASLPYHELRELSEDGSDVFEGGARDRLAAAELRRLGLDRQSERLRDASRARERVR